MLMTIDYIYTVYASFDRDNIYIISSAFHTMEVCILLCYVTNGSPYIGWSGIAILNRVCGHFRSRFSPLFSILYLVFLYLVFLLLLSVMTLIFFYQIMSDISVQILTKIWQWRNMPSIFDVPPNGNWRTSADYGNISMMKTCEILLHAFDTSRHDFLNSSPFGLSDSSSELPKMGRWEYCTPTHIRNVRRWVCMYVCVWVSKHVCANFS